MYSGVSARFADFASITWINGPFNDTERCESALERTKSRLKDSCPQCRVTYDRCFHIASLHPTYRRILEQVRVRFPYVFAPKAGAWLIYSDGVSSQLIEMCEVSAEELRQDLDHDTVCMLPSN